MAEVFILQKQDVKAIGEYRKVLELKPDLPGVHEELGNALVRRGNLPGALREFEAEVKLQPFSASAHVNAGQVLLMLGRDDEAGKMLNAALNMDRPPIETWLLLGKLNVRKRDYRNAVAMLTHYTSLDQGNSTAYFQLAMAYRALGEKDKMNRAIAQYKKTSVDAKQRSKAQRELRPLEQQGEITDEAEAQTSTVQ